MPKDTTPPQNTTLGTGVGKSAAALPSGAQPDEPSAARAAKPGGPTIEEYVSAGFDPASYPPNGWAEVPSEGLAAYRATGSIPGVKRAKLADGSTHLIVRSRNEGFRRAGLRFTREWTSVPVADLTDDQVSAIEKDPMLDARRGDAETAAEYVSASHVEDDATPTQLRQVIARERARAEAAEETVKQLRARYEGGELPPPPGRLPNGDPIR